jgi:hypothetical protein
MAMAGTYTITDDQRREILRQIGNLNVLAISGGRVTALADGVELPVGNKGYRDDVDFTQVGEAAYYASCYRNDGGEWTYNG